MNLLKFSHQEILFENYDDELILLDLVGGVYYTINRTGADGLLVLLAASALDDAKFAMSQRFDECEEVLHSSMSGMIRQLLEFGVVKYRDEKEIGISQDIDFKEKIPFGIPLVEQYKDIEDILKFDPIHDVADDGWPRIRETSPP